MEKVITENQPIKFMISVPRSGQHMTKDSLKKYHELLCIDYSYCEFYTCCQEIPCKKNPASYHKNHDFNINHLEGININNKDKYLFLYRNNLLEQIESHFRFFYFSNSNISSNIKLDYSNETNMNYFKEFIKENIYYYKKIYLKWLIEKPNIIKVEFDDYLMNFSERFKEILLFFGILINDDFIEEVKKYINPVINKKIDENDPYYESLNEFIKSLIEDESI